MEVSDKYESCSIYNRVAISWIESCFNEVGAAILTGALSDPRARLYDEDADAQKMI
jgi:hypothetical protein